MENIIAEVRSYHVSDEWFSSCATPKKCKFDPEEHFAASSFQKARELWMETIKFPVSYRQIDESEEQDDLNKKLQKFLRSADSCTEMKNRLLLIDQSIENLEDKNIDESFLMDSVLPESVHYSMVRSLNRSENVEVCVFERAIILLGKERKRIITVLLDVEQSRNDSFNNLSEDEKSLVVNRVSAYTEIKNNLVTSFKKSKKMKYKSSQEVFNELTMTRGEFASGWHDLMVERAARERDAKSYALGIRCNKDYAYIAGRRIRPPKPCQCVSHNGFDIQTFSMI